jgi:DNA-directed RNA polymerase II subunit RPB2
MAAPKIEQELIGENGFPLDHINKDDAWAVIRSYFN